MIAVAPPLRFATVEEGVHRGAYPTLVNFRFLRRLRLRTIVSLLPEQPSTDLRDFCEHEEIRHHYVPTERSQPVGLSAEAVYDVLRIVMLEESLPAYIHCLDGFATTGIVVMCLRKVQRWAPAAARKEFSRFSRVRSELSVAPTAAQVQFVDAFAVDPELHRFSAGNADGLSPWLRRSLHVLPPPGAADNAEGLGGVDGLAESSRRGKHAQARYSRTESEGAQNLSSVLDALALEGLPGSSALGKQRR